MTLPSSATPVTVLLASITLSGTVFLADRWKSPLMAALGMLGGLYPPTAGCRFGRWVAALWIHRPAVGGDPLGIPSARLGVDHRNAGFCHHGVSALLVRSTGRGHQLGNGLPVDLSLCAPLYGSKPAPSMGCQEPLPCCHTGMAWFRLVGDDDAFHGRPWGDDPASTLDRSLLAGSRGMPVSPVTAS